MSDGQDTAQWRRVEQLFHAAAALPPDRRDDFLLESCADDPQEREEVMALLRGDGQESTLTRIVGNATTSLIRPPSRDGSLIGAYRLLTLIGEGGMGLVYSAERADKLFEKRVAIKLVNAAQVSEELGDHFASERQILASLEHANIARLLDGGTTDDGVPYLVMEYVQGEPLDRYCDRHGLGLSQRLALFVKICAAVHYAHQQLVIHCDLKMSNIYVTPDGEPRLLDFGVSRLMTRAGESALEVGAVAGMRRLTLRYASPEQVRGDALTTATDVYGLGVILCELMTGHLPYAAEDSDTQAYAQAIMSDAPRAPSEVAGSSHLRRRLRGDLDSIVMKSLQKSPSDRYASVARLSEDIADYMALRPVIARDGRWHYRFGKLVRRNRLASMTSLVLLVSLLVFANALLERNRQIVLQRDVAQFERDKAETVTNFLTDMFAQASPLRAQGREISVRDVLDVADTSLQGSFDERFAGNPLVAASIRRTVADVYLDLGLHDAAGPHIEWALAALLRQGQVSSVEYVRALLSKSRWLGARFEHESAVPVMEQALALSERILGKDDPLTLSALNALGVANHMSGRLNESAGLFQESYDRWVRMEGEVHVGSIRALRSLATIRYWLGDYARAEEGYRSCSTLGAQVMGEKHPDTLICLGNLGSVLEGGGRYEEAEPIIKRHLEHTREVLGENHQERLRSMHNLADVYRGLERLGEAEDLFVDTLARRRKELGLHHVETLQTQMKLARLYRQQGYYARARPLMEDTLLRQRGSLGASHPTTLIAAQEMADLLLASGDVDAAGGLYAEVLSARTSILGDEHPDLLATMAGLAEVHYLTGDSGEYRRLMERAIDLANRYPDLRVPGFADRRLRFLERGREQGPDTVRAGLAIDSA